jgi:hypothetical protein
VQRANRQVGSLLLVGVGAAFCTSQSSAAEWRMTPAMNIGTSYTDNPRLLMDGGESAAGATGELSASLKRSSERSEFSLRPRVYSSRYEEDETLDSDDRYLSAGYRWIGQRGEWNMGLDLTQDSTLTSELGQTGIVQTDRRHEAASFTVSPNVMFTERVSGGVQMYLLDSRYIDAERTGLVDYRYTTLSLFSSVALSETGSNLNVTAQAGELSADVIGRSETRDGSLKIALSHQPWESWTASLSAGPSFVETDAGSDSDAIFGAELKRTAERWSFATSLSRSQSPTGRGVLTRRDRVLLNCSRALAERLSASVSAQWIRNQDLQVQASGGSRSFHVDYGQLDLSADWRLARSWSLLLRLSGNTQKYNTGPERAEGYRASLSMVWNGQPQTL